MGGKGRLTVLTRATFFRYWLLALLWGSLIGLFYTSLFEAKATVGVLRAV